MRFYWARSVGSLWQRWIKYGYVYMFHSLFMSLVYLRSGWPIDTTQMGYRCTCTLLMQIQTSLQEKGSWVLVKPQCTQQLIQHSPWTTLWMGAHKLSFQFWQLSMLSSVSLYIISVRGGSTDWCHVPRVTTGSIRATHYLSCCFVDVAFYGSLVKQQMFLTIILCSYIMYIHEQHLKQL